ncbi:procathepsin L-like [Chiloscyllium plagiosum]|uniref:procathepsin L-like n=1 Tax=Chiloscyllium plagiosum TaxID=36176 RepID=UPI001CB7FADC|nr:procathepsin L-like [Chiloscyllium plagiosum]
MCLNFQTNEEFNKLMNGLLRIEAVNMTEIETDERDESSESEESHIELRTATVDWRREGLVTPVKNQGQCHSDWAFSATGAIEGQWAKRHGKLVSLSEQNLIDCRTGPIICSGSNALTAFHQVIQLQGINSAETYPYIGKHGRYCKFQPDKIAAKITNHKWVSGGEAALEQAVREIGPMSVVINASLKSFQHYKGGKSQSTGRCL